MKVQGLFGHHGIRSLGDFILKSKEENVNE